MNKAGERRKQFQLETYGMMREDLSFRFGFYEFILALPKINLNNQTSRLIILRNQSLTLQCPVSGYPTPIIRW